MESAGEHWELLESEKGALSTIFMLGMFCGSSGWGYLGDKKGRKFAFKRTVTISFFSSLLLTVAPNYTSVIILIWFLGLGIGGEVALGGTIFSEVCPPSKSWTLTLLGACWCMGGSIAAILALVIELVGTGNLELWRWIFGISTVLEFIFMLIRLPMDESPKYLALIGLNESAKELLYKIARRNGK